MIISYGHSSHSNRERGRTEKKKGRGKEIVTEVVPVSWLWTVGFNVAAGGEAGTTAVVAGSDLWRRRRAGGAAGDSAVVEEKMASGAARDTAAVEEKTADGAVGDADLWRRGGPAAAGVGTCGGEDEVVGGGGLLKMQIWRGSSRPPTADEMGAGGYRRWRRRHDGCGDQREGRWLPDLWRMRVAALDLWRRGAAACCGEEKERTVVEERRAGEDEAEFGEDEVHGGCGGLDQ